MFNFGVYGLDLWQVESGEKKITYQKFYVCMALPAKLVDWSHNHDNSAEYTPILHIPHLVLYYPNWNFMVTA